MKIAIATNDGKRVTGHIGKCRSFMVYEIDGDKIINEEHRENLFTNHRLNPEHHDHAEGHGHSHTHLIEGLKDCSYLISKGGGWRVVEDLKQHNIITLFTDVDLISDAVNMFTKGELKNDAGLVCNHH
ncbi:MAG: NifB/NifX family molybdenum-iron cluster-binding protein [Ignavibacteriaceae bacterium]